MKLSSHVHLVGSEQFGLSHPLDCNCYLIDGGLELGLIDTGLGLGYEDILANITNAGFQLERLRHIVLTHSHIGHWGGADAIRRRTGATVWAPENGVQGMTELQDDISIQTNLRFGRYPAGFVPQPCEPDRTFTGAGRIDIGDCELRVISTAGHTKDSTCFLIDMLLPGHGVFVLRRGQKHIQRAIHKLNDFVVPPSFFEDNEFMWDREYLRTMAG